MGHFMANRWLGPLVKHLSLMAATGLLLLVMVVQVFLPSFTNAGKHVVVPDLTGCSIEEVEEMVKKYRLRFCITDEVVYSGKMPARVVLQQYPKEGSVVKINRCVHVTLNAAHPPAVRMPNLIDKSIREAELLLQNSGLKVGSIKQVPDFACTVLEQWHDGDPIEAGASIYRGESVDLVVGMGQLSHTMVTVPDLIDLPLEEVNLILVERGIRIGAIHHVKMAGGDVGMVVKQSLEASTQVPLGTTINLWVTDL